MDVNWNDFRIIRIKKENYEKISSEIDKDGKIPTNVLKFLRRKIKNPELIDYLLQNPQIIEELEKLLSNREINPEYILPSNLFDRIHLQNLKTPKDLYRLLTQSYLGINPEKIEDPLGIGELINFSISKNTTSSRELHALEVALYMSITGNLWNLEPTQKILEEMERKGINTKLLIDGYNWIYNLSNGKLTDLEEAKKYEFKEFAKHFISCGFGIFGYQEKKISCQELQKYLGERPVENYLKNWSPEENLVKSVNELYFKNGIEEALKYVEEYLKSDQQKRRYQELLSMIRKIECLKNHKLCGKYLVSSTKKDSFQLFGNISAACCTLYPRGVQKISSPAYVMLPMFIVWGHKFLKEIYIDDVTWSIKNSGGYEKLLDGWALIYIAEKDGEIVGIFDGLEGGYEFRRLLKDESFVNLLVDEMILNYLGKLGIKYVIFNSFARENSTPQKFHQILLPYLGKRDGWKGIVEWEIRPIAKPEYMREILSFLGIHPYEIYLEAVKFKNENFEGIAKGWLYELRK